MIILNVCAFSSFNIYQLPIWTCYFLINPQSFYFKEYSMQMIKYMSINNLKLSLQLWIKADKYCSLRKWQFHNGVATKLFYHSSFINLCVHWHLNKRNQIIVVKLISVILVVSDRVAGAPLFFYSLFLPPRQTLYRTARQCIVCVVSMICRID